MIEIRKVKDTIQSLSQPPDLVQVPRDGKLQLSFAQQRMWFLYQLDSCSPFYNESLQIQIIGTLNVTVLEQSINEIIRRHEALRTTFPTIEGVPFQAIAPTLSITLPVVNLQGLTEASVQQLVAREIRQPFDLVTGPLLRVTLLHLSPETHLLILTMHHIITDGWSMGIFLKELGTLYQAFTNGEPSPLPELAIQYADFSVWQREWLTGEVMQKQLNYWKQQLADAPPLLKLPTDYPRPPVQTFCGATRLFEVDPDLTFQLKTLSRKSGVTLFMTLLTAFVTLLYRYSSQEDICVGFPIANREYSELDPLIGFFVNTLVLRTQIEDNPSFSELLEKVGHLALDAYAHQNAPFEQVVEALKPERSLGYNPLFQVTFAMHNLLLDTFDLPGIKLTPERVERGTSQFDLSLGIRQTKKGLTGSWEYNSDLFEPDTIARMTGHFQTLLKAIVANPDQRVGELPFLTESERYQLLVEWNNTTKEYPFNKCIHELFEEQVRRSPDAIAVSLESEQLTYRELNQWANRIAHYLRSLGVGPEVLVGICVERSPLMLVGLLAILKAGGAYVPLDPAYPAERLAYMLSDSQVKVLLTQQTLANTLPQNQAKLICLDKDWSAEGMTSQENLVTGVKPNNLAFVIYTSGSTGQPKGVMICQQSVVNYTVAKKVLYGINSSENLTGRLGERILQFSSLSFDGAVDEIYTCLSLGATLVLRSDEILSSFRTFLQKCQEWQITVLALPTAYWHQLVSEIAATQESLPASVRLVSVVGEAVLPEKLRLWQEYVQPHWQSHHQLAKPPLLMNGYGTTEATVDTTICNLSELVLEDTRSIVPIGRPIANVQLYILNQYLQIVPIGVPGELYIGGAGLARGYLNRPDLTAEKFIPNPFSNEAEARLYKTGDLVRYLSDGSIEFLGRIDNQVKIRGFRIELGEIEAVLTQHPEVDQAVVMVHEDQPGNKRLVAYIVPTGALNSKEDLTHKIKADIRQQLPEYMVPATLMILSVLPLTPNGKVDRRALPPPDQVVRYLALEIPQTKVEKLIADVWQKILLLEKVGLDDNFFDLGGNSLRLVQVWQKLQIIFTKKISMVEMFQHPTVRALGQLLSEQKSQTPDALKSEAERAELRSSSQGDMNQRRNIRQQYRSQKKQ